MGVDAKVFRKSALNLPVPSLIMGAGSVEQTRGHTLAMTMVAMTTGDMHRL